MAVKISGADGEFDEAMLDQVSGGARGNTNG